MDVNLGMQTTQKAKIRLYFILKDGFRRMIDSQYSNPDPSYPLSNLRTHPPILEDSLTHSLWRNQTVQPTVCKLPVLRMRVFV